jgi:tRNA (Thr-GGU) A37 N-methylase
MAGDEGKPAMTRQFTMTAIAEVVGGRILPEDDAWGASRAVIQLAAGYSADALAGLDSFSHADIVFVFDQLPESEITTAARRPRGNPLWPLVGIFAQRGRNRPNRIGVSVCRIVAVKGTLLEVEGLDAIAGTPVLDIKPVLSGFLPRGPMREPDWAGAIMADYW